MGKYGDWNPDLEEITTRANKEYTYRQGVGLDGYIKPIIVAAANRLKNGVILVGARHWDRHMHMQFDAMGGDDRQFTEQGFIDQKGNFYNRVDALKVVKESGQYFDPDRNGSDKELYSEGLY